MKVIDITKSFYSNSDFCKLYYEAFPKIERFKMFKLKNISKKMKSKFLNFYDNDLFVGFVVLIIYKNMILLLYFAVNPIIRNQGYGSKILFWLKKHHKENTIVLNIESISDNANNCTERLKRFNFYIINGYQKTNFRLLEKAINYDILFYGKTFDKLNYSTLLKKMYGIFYHPKIEGFNNQISN